MDKTKRTVTAGVHIGDQIEPRHRALRRQARRLKSKISESGKFREVGHLPRLHELP